MKSMTRRIRTPDLPSSQPGSLEAESVAESGLICFNLLEFDLEVRSYQ